MAPEHPCFDRPRSSSRPGVLTAPCRDAWNSRSRSTRTDERRFVRAYLPDADPDRDIQVNLRGSALGLRCERRVEYPDCDEYGPPSRHVRQGRECARRHVARRRRQRSMAKGSCWCRGPRSRRRRGTRFLSRGASCRSNDRDAQVAAGTWSRWRVRTGRGTMHLMEEVNVRPISLERLAAILPDDRGARLATAAELARATFGDRVVWHVNATAHGGGVAEMLQTLLAYGKAAGVENRWMVLDGDAGFFAITKRLHNNLHGEPGDGGSLGPAEHAHYEAVLRSNLAELVDLVSPGDIVLAPRPPDRRVDRGPARAGSTRGLAVSHRTRSSQRPDPRGVGLPSAVPDARGGAGVLPAGLCTGVGRRRPVDRHSSLDRPVRHQEHASPTRGRHRHPRQGGHRGRRWSAGSGRLRQEGRRHRDACGPIAAREGSCSAANRLRSTYRSWCR